MEVDFGKPHKSELPATATGNFFSYTVIMGTWKNYVRSDQFKPIFSLSNFLRNCSWAPQTSIYHITDSRNLSRKVKHENAMNSSTFYGLHKAWEKTMACDIPSGSEDSDLSDSEDDYLLDKY